VKTKIDAQNQKEPDQANKKAQKEVDIITKRSEKLRLN
jgi:hypothetical protein